MQWRASNIRRDRRPDQQNGSYDPVRTKDLLYTYGVPCSLHQLRGLGSTVQRVYPRLEGAVNSALPHLKDDPKVVESRRIYGLLEKIVDGIVIEATVKEWLS